MKESIKVIPRNTGTYLFCAPVTSNRKRLLNIWNLLSEDKNIAVAQLMSIINYVNDRVVINQCFSLDQVRNIPKKVAKFTFEKHHAGTVQAILTQHFVK